MIEGCQLRRVYINIFLICFLFCETVLYAVCPQPPPRKKFNYITGTIASINEPGVRFQITKDLVRVWVEGTMHFTIANKEGYFVLHEVDVKNIVLRFEYMGRVLYLDLGEGGGDQLIEIKDIELGGGKIKYAEIKRAYINELNKGLL